MSIVISIASVVLAIMILVFVHEMGHFLFAKLFKMRVDRFSIGFPPKIIGKTIGETEYMIGATPLGGYVKIAGMVDESLDTDYSGSEPKPWEFRAKPVWQRIIVITAGVIFNVILAAVIFSGLKYVYGEAQPLATEDGSVFVSDSSLAYDIGLRTGDRVLAVGGRPFHPYDGLRSMDALMAESLTIEVEREGQRMTLVGPDDIMTQIGRAGGEGFFGLGLSFEPSILGGIVEESPAAAIGLQEGDRIIAIDGQPVQFWSQMTEMIQAADGQTFTVRWIPGGSGTQAREAQVMPERDEQNDRYYLGVFPGVRYETYSLGRALVSGVEDTWLNTKMITTNLRRIVTGREDFRENLGGPVMVARITGQAARAGWRSFWNIVAMLSITLAIVNILPIPALDGGHLMFLLYEGITRREPSLRVRVVMQQVGMVLLLTLMVFLVFNDILRL